MRWSQLDRTKRIDAEYFEARHLQTVATLRRHRTDSLTSIVDVSDGNHFEISSEFVESGIPYYRGQDVVGHFFVENSTPNQISERAYNASHMLRSHLKKGDVLLSIVATIGELSLVGSATRATCSCKLAILRPHSIASEYLAVFLRSKFGQSQIERLKRGAVQQGLLLEDMDQLRVARLGEEFELRIVEEVRRARGCLAKSRALIESAEAQLLDALSLTDWEPVHPLTYIGTASATRRALRLDAEYFSPAKVAAKQKLLSKSGRSISDLAISVREVFDPKRQDPSMLVRNFDVTHALESFLDEGVAPVRAGDIGSNKKRFARGDVVVSRLRSYLKEIAIVRTTDAVPAVGSSEFIVLRLSQRAVSAETLSIFLRSRPVQIILKWSQDGSHHPRFSEHDLLSIPVPDQLYSLAGKIDALVAEAYTLRERAERLLEQAKEAVETAVEQNEKVALRLLDSAN